MIGWTHEVIELTKLALARFTDLTESELKVLIAPNRRELDIDAHAFRVHLHDAFANRFNDKVAKAYGLR